MKTLVILSALGLYLWAVSGPSPKEQAEARIGFADLIADMENRRAYCLSSDREFVRNEPACAFAIHKD